MSDANMRENFLQDADRLMEEARVCQDANIVHKVASAVDALIAYLKQQESGVAKSFDEKTNTLADLHDKIDDEMERYIAGGGLCSEEKCVMGCRGCGEKSEAAPAAEPKLTALDVLRKMNDIISLGDLCYTVRESEGLGWEGPKVVAWGIACMRMKQLFEKADATPEMPSGMEPWPEDWPPYHHRNQPCDMKVGPCACGAWHSEGEFSLERDGMGSYYVNRRPVKFPGDHVGSDGYSSQCDCCVCKDYRIAAVNRGRHGHD